MGIAWIWIKQLEALGAIPKPGGRILDVGSSNLYSAPADQVSAFIRARNPDAVDVDVKAARIEAGSAYDVIHGGKNEAFAGEVFTEAGISYDAIDVAEGYKTTIVDLNHHQIPETFNDTFDLVMNFGTTEHIFNQWNSFQAIHNATKAGGLMFHQLPCVGWVDHCYFVYTGRFFFDLAGYNNYELIDFTFTNPGGPENIFASVRSFSSAYPVLPRLISKIGNEVLETNLNETKIPTISANVLFRKKVNAPFIGAVELSTSIGLVPNAVKREYSR